MTWDMEINIVNEDEVFNGGLCWYEPTGIENEYICVSCKRVITSKAKDPLLIHHPCQVKKTRQEILKDNNIKLPSIVTRLGNFGIAYIKHILKGNEACTDNEIAERFSICNAPGLDPLSKKQPCIYYSKDDGVCLECGCNVNLMRADVGLNKLSWKDSKCSKGFW